MTKLFVEQPMASPASAKNYNLSFVICDNTHCRDCSTHMTLNNKLSTLHMISTQPHTKQYSTTECYTEH